MFHTKFPRTIIIVLVVVMILSLQATAAAQEKKPLQMSPRPVVNSPEVMPDGKVAFRILAPKTESIGLQASDMLGMGDSGPEFKKDENGVWEAIADPISPGAYRYRFMVDEVAVIDPRNPSISESNGNAWSLVYIPGAEFMDARKVPHGAVAAVHYYSTSLGRHRRMHVYTPPGYETDNRKYPVFYLLHGAGDCDDSWSSVGRAGFIMDNLIAEKKAKPMIVVMPAGHTSASFRMGGGSGSMVDEFSQDFVNDIMPYVETNYRVLTDRQSRAMAGLSMGGMQTLSVTMSHLGKFSYIGVFSSGVFGMAPKKAKPAAETSPKAAPTVSWEEQHQAMLDDAGLKKDLKLLWFATGADDFLVDTTRTTVEMLKKHGFSPVYKESAGGHTWINWREYLNEFAPQLFQ